MSKFLNTDDPGGPISIPNPPAAIPSSRSKISLVLLPDGGPRTVSKTIVMEYNVGTFPEGGPTGPCQMKYKESLPPKTMFSEGEAIVGIYLQPIMEGEAWPDNFATRVIAIDEVSWTILFLVQRTDNFTDGWGEDLSISASFHLGPDVTLDDPPS